jgi:hypothetical protein
LIHFTGSATADNLDQEHHKNLRFGIKLSRELFQQQEYHPGGTESQREQWPLGKSLQQEGAEVVLKKQEQFGMLRAASQSS